MTNGVQNEEQVYTVAHTLGIIDDLGQALSLRGSAGSGHGHEALGSRASARIQDLYPGLGQLVLHQTLSGDSRIVQSAYLRRHRDEEQASSGLTRSQVSVGQIARRRCRRGKCLRVFLEQLVGL